MYQASNTGKVKGTQHWALTAWLCVETEVFVVVDCLVDREGAETVKERVRFEGLWGSEKVQGVVGKEVFEDGVGLERFEGVVELEMFEGVVGAEGVVQGSRVGLALNWHSRGGTKCLSPNWSVCKQNNVFGSMGSPHSSPYGEMKLNISFGDGSRNKRNYRYYKYVFSCI